MSELLSPEMKMRLSDWLQNAKFTGTEASPFERETTRNGVCVFTRLVHSRLRSLFHLKGQEGHLATTFHLQRDRVTWLELTKRGAKIFDAFDESAIQSMDHVAFL